MKKLIKYTKVIILLVLLSSCNKHSKIESIFIANKNEYWKYENHCQDSKGIYFQFKKNGSYDNYLLYTKEGVVLFNEDGDVLESPRNWSVKNDSTLIIDYVELKINKITNNDILLSYNQNKIKNKKCEVRLTKWIYGPKGPKKISSSMK